MCVCDVLIRKDKVNIKVYSVHYTRVHCTGVKHFIISFFVGIENSKQCIVSNVKLYFSQK